MPDDQDNPGVASRRKFLTGAGVAVGAGLASRLEAATRFKQDDAPKPPAEPTGEVPEPLNVKFTLNGQEKSLDVDPRATLLDTLRENIGLTGTKKGCDHGACGACTCHVDGSRVLSCFTLAATLGGREVTTIEGLEKNGELHPVQKAFLQCDGYQCGYCTPGQIMSGVACINEGHAAGDDEEIREYMSGNLCRCGAYPNIVDAIKQAAGEMGRRAQDGGAK